MHFLISRKQHETRVSFIGSLLIVINFVAAIVIVRVGITVVVSCSVAVIAVI